jgi:hypothetical protein
LREGKYLIHLKGYTDTIVVDNILSAATFFVINGDFYKTGRIPNTGKGFVFVDHSFSFVSNNDGNGSSSS